VVPVAAAGWRARAHPSRGFTLLELLLVLVIMALLTTLVTISTRPDPRQALVLQARRIGLLMSLASDEARMRRQAIDWEADLHSYRFVIESQNDRTTFASDDMLRERAWDPPLTRLAVIDLASGTSRALVSADAPPLRVPAAFEWVQSPWRLELGNEYAAVAVEFDARGRAGVVQ